MFDTIGKSIKISQNIRVWSYTNGATVVQEVGAHLVTSGLLVQNVNICSRMKAKHILKLRAEAGIIVWRDGGRGYTAKGVLYQHGVKDQPARRSNYYKKLIKTMKKLVCSLQMHKGIVEDLEKTGLIWET